MCAKDATKPEYTGLVPISDVQCLLLYASQGLRGAMHAPFLSSLAVPPLRHAARSLRAQSTPPQSYALLIWDAYRTPQTQAALYDRCVRDLMAEEGLTSDEAFARARAFAALPTAVFPHGTGGAVDVTLLINDKPAPMGTGFDDFVPQSASDWYRRYPPQTEADTMAATNREILRATMEAAGFVGLDSEWWHFEWGTSRWAKSTGMPVVLGAVLAPPLPPIRPDDSVAAEHGAEGSD